jgi:aryl-alcohol dehydrogenase-like predicted oxidoreductase
MPKVPKVKLGATELQVSRLGFGTFDFGVPSLHISPRQGARVLKESHGLGVDYWDTSEDYGSHAHIAAALRLLPRREVVISTKTNAKSPKGASKAVKDALRELGTDYLDIVLLHYVKSNWIDRCRRVLRRLSEIKTTGLVRAIGVSTHSVVVVREAARFTEVDVIMTICCKADQAMIDTFPEHIPLEDDSMKEMHDAIRVAHTNGKGVIAMKVLGTSAAPLIADYSSSIRWVAKSRLVDSMVIGMRNLDQVRKNARAILCCLKRESSE